MAGYCKVFEGIYAMDKGEIHGMNVEAGIYNLRQIEAVFWRLMERMKDFNLFFPDPDLLRPFLFVKNMEMECYHRSQSVDISAKYENIADGVYRFIDFGVFVSPELIEDLCESLEIAQERTRCVLSAFLEKRKQQQQLRLNQ